MAISGDVELDQLGHVHQRLGNPRLAKWVACKVTQQLHTCSRWTDLTWVQALPGQLGSDRGNLAPELRAFRGALCEFGEADRSGHEGQLANLAPEVGLL